MTSHRAIVQDYLDAWKQKDLARIKSRLHPEAAFRGPLAQHADRDSFMPAIQRMLALLTEVDVRGVFEEDDRAVAIYDFVFVEPIGRTRIADLMTFEGDLIRSSEIIYDARRFEAAQRLRAAS